MSYSVAQRTREIGIRLAVGAQPRNVLGHAMKLVLIGVVIGAAASMAVSQVIKSLLFGMSTADPATFLGVALLVALVAACWVPARRATRVDPMVALRYE